MLICPFGDQNDECREQQHGVHGEDDPEIPARPGQATQEHIGHEQGVSARENDENEPTDESCYRIVGGEPHSPQEKRQEERADSEQGGWGNPHFPRTRVFRHGWSRKARRRCNHQPGGGEMRDSRTGT